MNDRGDQTEETHPPSLGPSETWDLFGRRIPKQEIVYFCQIIVLYIIIITSVINISLGNDSEIWLILLSSSLGTISPSPNIKNIKLKKNIIQNSIPQQ